MPLMMSRRRFLLSSVGLALSTPLSARAVSNGGLRIGLLADAQYADQPPARTRFYRASLRKLQEAISRFDEEDLDLCINLGDLVDKDWNSFQPVLKAVNGARQRFYHVLGNHDFDVAADYKKRVPERLGMARRYYVISRGRFCFVVLDTTDISPYTHPDSSPEHRSAMTLLERIRKTGALNAEPWNGAISDRQLKWLETTCQKASKAGQSVIVFAHHPVFPENVHNLWNAQDVLGVVKRRRNIVAWFNGHNHSGGFGEFEGVPFVTLKGMVETESSNAFCLARLDGGGIVLDGCGREVSRRLKFRNP